MSTITEIPIEDPKEPNKKLFKIACFADLIELVGVIVMHLKKKNKLQIQLLSRDRFKYQEIRAAYFCYLKDITKSAASDGRNVHQLHTDYKASFLVRILAREYEWFADLVLESVKRPSVELAIEKLISIADGSIVNSPILMEYFHAVQMDWEAQSYVPPEPDDRAEDK